MHSHSNNDIVVKILTKIATKEKKPYKKIKKLFVVKCDTHVTHCFWDILAQEFPGHHYTEVSHCPGCREFSLE